MNILRKFTPCKKQYSTSSLNRNMCIMKKIINMTYRTKKTGDYRNT